MAPLLGKARLALFIDGANLHASSRALGFDVDYRKVLSHFGEGRNLLRAFYYTAIDDDPDFSPLRPLIDWLDYNGFTVVTKAAKEYVSATGHRKIKRNMDIEVAVDMFELSPYLDEAILFSGDGDFVSVIRAIQRTGTRCTAVSTVATSPPMIADELRRRVDEFIDLKDLVDDIGRDVDEKAMEAIDRAVERG